MSSNTQNASLGTEIEIIRQRYFIDYSSTSKRYLSQELTLICRSTNKDGIDGFFLQVPELLPNLKIFDSDGTQLSLITNNLTIGLLQQNIDVTTGETKEQLEQLLDDAINHRTYILWIKLPHEKKFLPDESRVITLEYDANDKVDPTETYDLEFLSNSNHEVFYIISPPDDYEFVERRMTVFDAGGEFVRDEMKGWENLPEDAIYFNEYENSITIRVPPEETNLITFSYSFKPKKKIFKFPGLILYFLTAASIMLYLSKLCNSAQSSTCKTFNIFLDLHFIYDKQIELGVGIIAASLIVASLIHNQDVRDFFKFWFFVPIVLTILFILIKF